MEHSRNRVFPDKANDGILAELMLLPDDFKVHFRRRFTTNLFQMLDGYLALLGSGLLAISVRSVF